MIPSFILYLLSDIMGGAFTLFPTGSIPTGVTSAVQTALSWMWMLNVAVDVPTLLQILSAYFVLEVSLQIVEFFFWVYSKVPIIGKK